MNYRASSFFEKRCFHQLLREYSAAGSLILLMISIWGTKNSHAENSDR